MKQTVLITGASSGFGKASAKLFQQKGWNVIAGMRSPEKEQELTALQNVLVVKLDVQDTTSINTAIEQGVKHFGSIDALVNSAGYGLMGVFESSTPEQVQAQYATNVFGLMNVTRAVLPFMRPQKRGAIVNISSVGGIVGLPFGSLYNSTKFAVEGFSEALSYEVAPFGIKVKIIEPGSVATNFRQSIDFIKNEIPEYDPLIGSLFQRFGKTTEHLSKASPEEVATAIYNAANDNTNKLRYIVGADTQFYADLKSKNTAAEFTARMHDYFVN